MVHCRGGDYQLVPAGDVSVGKSTNAWLQSTTLDASTACVAVPLTVMRASADGWIGRLTPLIN